MLVMKLVGSGQRPGHLGGGRQSSPASGSATGENSRLRQPAYARLYRQPRGAAFYAEAWRALEEQVAAAGDCTPPCATAAVSPWGRWRSTTDRPGCQLCGDRSGINAFWQDRRYLPSLLQQELAPGRTAG
ncbi:hypothetical protein ACNKHR_28240 [Shigella flexneri]